MIKSKKDWMTIGSVVTLREGVKRLMIVGRIQRGGDGELYDYAGVLWPEGMVRSDRMYLFNHEDIEILWHYVLLETDEIHFREVLNEQVELLAY